MELYVNDVMVNYVKADASGFYAFDVPVVYGNSGIKLRIYGPWGEERTLEQNISIPFNFLPARQFEYNVSGGIVDDDHKSFFSRANFNYGLSKRITIGGGTEYLSSVNSRKPMPFMNASLRLSSNLLVSGEYTHGVRRKGTLNYRLPSDIQLDLNYTKYEKSQTAIRFNYLEERKAVLSVPFRGRKLSGFSRLTYNGFKVPKSKNNSAEFLLSAIVSGVSSNFTTYALFTDPGHPYVYSNLSLTFRLPLTLRFTPHIQYDYRQKKISMMKAEVEKRLGKTGFVNFSYEKNIPDKISFINFGLRLNFSFAQTSFSVRQGNQTTTMVQSARGSLIYNDKTNNLTLNNESNAGKGGLTIVPFLDLNCNERWDVNEPKVSGLNLRVNGGGIKHNKKDTTISITGLEAYTNYFIELDKNSFDNIAWQLKNKTISVMIEPNHYKVVEVPVAVLGEASGMVYLDKNREQKGLSRILVNIYDSSSNLVAQTLTEGDGYFSYLGLAPGSYIARIDTAQLHNLNLISIPETLSFNIASSEEGVVADGFTFTLKLHQGIHKQEAESHNEQQLTIQKEQQAVFQELPEIEKKSLPLTQQKQQSAIQKKKLPVAENKQPAVQNKQQPVIQQKSKAVVQKKSQPIQQKSKENVQKKEAQPDNSEKLVQQYQLIDQKLQQVLQKQQELIKEQQLLIEKNRQLLREIQQLRLKVQQLNLKKMQSPVRKK